MCELCSNNAEEKQAEVRRLLIMKDRLDNLSGLYEQLAYGELKPHSKDMDKVSSLSKLIIKNLVEEWL